MEDKDCLKDRNEFCDIQNYFPERISEIINLKMNDISLNYNVLEEIRIRVGKPIILKFRNKEIILAKCIVSKEEINNLFQKLCNNSIYTYQREIINGFITIKGGHRVGITGEAVLDKENIINIKYISSLNFRITHNVIDCSNFLLRYILNIETGEIYNTLIVSSPGAGKTTILKDLVKKISNGIEEINFKGQDVTVIDERGEISAMYEGILQNDLGIRTDVIQNVPKAIGIKMCIRSMAPKVIVADEIGNFGEAEAIKNAFCSGIKGIFTAHGDDFLEICLNSELNNLLKNCLIEKIIFLDKKEKGKLKYVYELDRKNKKYKNCQVDYRE